MILQNRLARIAGATALVPLLASCVAGVIQSGVGAGPVDVTTVGVSNALDLGMGTAAVLAAAIVGVLAMIGGVAPGPATFIGFPVFAMVLNRAVEVVPEPTGAAAAVQFAVSFVLATVFVAGIVAFDVGVAPPEALMLVLHRRTGYGLGPVRIALDVSFCLVGLALGATIGFGTLVVAATFGPLVALWIPHMKRLVGPPAVLASVAAGVPPTAR